MRWSLVALLVWTWLWAWGVGLPAREWWTLALPYLLLGLACLVVEVLDGQATRMVKRYTEDTDT